MCGFLWIHVRESACLSALIVCLHSLSGAQMAIAANKGERMRLPLISEMIARTCAQLLAIHESCQVPPFVVLTLQAKYIR